MAPPSMERLNDFAAVQFDWVSPRVRWYLHESPICMFTLLNSSLLFQKVQSVMGFLCSKLELVTQFG